MQLKNGGTGIWARLIWGGASVEHRRRITQDSGPQSDVVAVNCAISACAAAARWQEAGEM